ncbi:NADH-quinone oxidoreductase subunit NuoN [Undibacterium sp. LX40W]|uniref:NADH-quinone oxidoreductase subunit N n=2 Tax=Oxalobacteraceae TaxID=75682 RepID=A0A923HJS0_9BURK|nr:NADH-quinone oxidoreductase subunit NuoN [Undibacterium nitidum]MBC3890917.1 NADH-quinone oxidoreductase subunit NuoN [Undibacterium sp. LX40W]
MTNMNLIPLQLYPEVFLLLSICAILLIDMFLGEEKRNVTYALSLLSIGVCGILTMNASSGSSVYLSNNMFVSDAMSNLMKLFSYIAVGVTFIYGRQYASDRGMTKGMLGGEFYVIALFALLGQMIMISGNNMLVIYLGLELMSLALYALVALRRDNTTSTEAAMKYFVLGALASGFLLYGISMIYGATGSLNLNVIATEAAKLTANKNILTFGIVFVVAGLAFKLGVVPFHMWVPDVYQGSPTVVTLLLGGAPKLAAFAICYRILAEGLFPQVIQWQQMLMVLAVMSMAVGNITAIAQTNLKRMLAYSTISQMGFMLLGFISGVSNANPALAVEAYSASMFYSITYVMTTLGTFGVILLLSRNGFEAEEIADLKGLNKRSKWFAFIMLLLMFSLAGIPPLMGFYAKLSVLSSVVAAGQIWLAVAAVLFSLIGAFYYLRIVKVMYFDEPQDQSAIVASADMKIVLSVNGLAVLLLGIVPGPLLTSCVEAIKSALAS